MRALTICQPYAHLISTGKKWIENRCWRPPCVGIMIAIHAGKSRSWMQPGDLNRFPGMAFSAIVAAAYLEGWVPAEFARKQYEQNPDGVPRGVVRSWRQIVEHPHFEGPTCWLFRDVWPLPEPIHVSGARGLWALEPRLVDAIVAQLVRQIGRLKAERTALH